MKQLKPWLLLMFSMMILSKGFSQYQVIVVQVTPGQCFTDSTAGPNGGALDSVQLIFPSATHGTVSTTLNSFTYCPDSGFVGNDTIGIRACIYGNGVFTCNNPLMYILEVQAPCTLAVNLIADTTACLFGGQHYTAVVTGGTPAYNYIWSDQSTGTGACQLNAGTALCISVTDALGCTATACTGNIQCTYQVVIVLDSITCNGAPGLTVVNYGGTGTYIYYWSTGDTAGTICNVSATTPYCVSALDANGCSAIICYTIPGVGNCSFNYNYQNAGGSQTIAFYGSYDSSYTVTSVTWDYGDGTTDNILNPVHRYANCGFDPLVTMTLHYSTGDSCSSSQNVWVYCDSSNNNGYLGCQAYFNASLSTDTLFFTDQSVYYPNSWSWDFGDGTGSTLQNPFHVYNSLGSWNVCLTITDSTTNCSSSYCQQVTNIAIQDLQAYLFHGSTVTPGYPVYVYLEYYNTGNLSMNGNVVYHYPAGTSFVYSTPAPATIDVANRSLTFNFNNLASLASDYIFVDLAADSTLALGLQVNDTMWVNPIVGDATPADNVSTVTDSVVASWDPNLKSVSPKGLGEKGFIDASTKEVSYIIHFQNTGNAPAQQVVIRDTINNNIDISSVLVTAASHDHTWQINGNELVVSFAHINLPDSGSNYTASQGSVSIHAKLKPSLPAGTQILNTASIYFDSNAPIVTNTVVNTIEDVTGIGNISGLEFELMPNPASTEVLIRGEFETTATFELLDLLGKQLQKGRISTTGGKMNVAELSAGIYLVKIKSGEKTGVQRLVVVR